MVNLLEVINEACRVEFEENGFAFSFQDFIPVALNTALVGIALAHEVNGTRTFACATCHEPTEYDDLDYSTLDFSNAPDMQSMFGRPPKEVVSNFKAISVEAMDKLRAYVSEKAKAV